MPAVRLGERNLGDDGRLGARSQVRCDDGRGEYQRVGGIGWAGFGTSCRLDLRRWHRWKG